VNYQPELGHFDFALRPIGVGQLIFTNRLQLQHYTVLYLCVHSSSWVQLMWW